MENKNTVMVFIRSTILWAVTLGLVPLYMVIGYLLYIVNARTRHKILSSWGCIFAFMAKYVCGVKYVVTGQENLPTEPSIIASNHQSTWETFGYVPILPQHVWILKRELIKLPFFGWTLRTASPIAIDRSNRVGSTVQILRQGAQRLAQGFWILVFPEGTRVAPDAVKPFKVGVARMAIELDVAVVPVANNAGYCMPRSSYMIHPGTVNVVIDKPIWPNPGETAEELIKRIEQVVRQNLAKISRPLASVEQSA
ncbi:MAG: 1-acyl-sn-glycerol-3-phosphate acyltransferase [Burkholderiales bacterium]|jgi:1-acyl-sn-glycerol-3-phosphate acyltransferase|nr:1-acyl-sn-glycerol-3-phosphate acyltransferase [Burkholderiales bacterium]